MYSNDIDINEKSKISIVYNESAHTKAQNKEK